MNGDKETILRRVCLEQVQGKGMYSIAKLYETKGTYEQ